MRAMWEPSPCETQRNRKEINWEEMTTTVYLNYPLAPFVCIAQSDLFAPVFGNVLLSKNRFVCENTVACPTNAGSLDEQFREHVFRANPFPVGLVEHQRFAEHIEALPMMRPIETVRCFGHSLQVALCAGSGFADGGMGRSTQRGSWLGSS